MQKYRTAFLQKGYIAESDNGEEVILSKGVLVIVVDDSDSENIKCRTAIGVGKGLEIYDLALSKDAIACTAESDFYSLLGYINALKSFEDAIR